MKYIIFRRYIKTRGNLTTHAIVSSFRFALRFIRPDPRGRVTDPVGDVVSFIHDFEEKYGRSHPVFYQGTYSQVNRNTKMHLFIR